MITEHVDTSNDLPPEPTHLRVRRDPPSGTIILDRPEKHNALGRRTIVELIQAFEDMLRSGGVRAVILTGAGSSFCAGTDLAEIGDGVGSDQSMAEWHDDAERIRELLEVMLRFPKPIIAATHGAVRGLGVALLAACDLVVAAPSTTIGLPEVRRGLVPAQTAPLLAFRIGVGHATPLLLTGRTIDVDEAWRIGLVHERATEDQGWVRAQAWATTCAEAARESVLLTKRLLNETIGEALESFQTVAAANAATARTTESAAEGVKAFLEKRPPSWDG